MDSLPPSHRGSPVRVSRPADGCVYRGFRGGFYTLSLQVSLGRCRRSWSHAEARVPPRLPRPQHSPTCTVDRAGGRGPCLSGPRGSCCSPGLFLKPRARPPWSTPWTWTSFPQWPRAPLPLLGPTPPNQDLTPPKPPLPLLSPTCDAVYSFTAFPHQTLTSAGWPLTGMPTPLWSPVWGSPWMPTPPLPSCWGRHRYSQFRDSRFRRNTLVSSNDFLGQLVWEVETWEEGGVCVPRRAFGSFTPRSHPRSHPRWLPPFPISRR